MIHLTFNIYQLSIDDQLTFINEKTNATNFSQMVNQNCRLLNTSKGGY